MGRVAIREAAVFLLFLLLTVAMTWPLLPNIRTAAIGPGDPYLNAWIIKWDYHAAFHQPLELFDAPVFYPLRDTLAFSEHMFGIALFGFPLFAAGLQPMTVCNILILLGFAFSGYGACILARMIVGRTAPAIAAGIFFAFVPFRFTHLSHLQHVWAGWLPLLLAALILYDRRPSWRTAALFGALFFFNGLTNVHWFVFGSFAAACTAIFFAAYRGRLRSLRWWIPLGVSTAAGLVLLLPFLLPYRTVSKVYGLKRSWSETLGYSAHWSDWLVISAQNKLLGRYTDPAVVIGEHWLFPGITAVVLSLVALFLARREDLPRFDEPRPIEPATPPPRTLRILDALLVLLAVLAFAGAAAGEVRLGGVLRYQGPGTPIVLFGLVLLVRLWIRFPRAWGDRSLAGIVRRSRFPAEVWAAMLWIGMGLWGSVGLNGWFHSFLFQHLEVFRSIRVPARWAMVTYAGMAVLVALGVQTLAMRMSDRRFRAGFGVAIAALLLFDLRAAPIRWYLAQADPPPVYRWIARAPHRGAILELPINEGDSEHTYMLRAAVHMRPIINGVLGFTPKPHQELTDLLHADPISDEVVGRLERLGCSLVVVHVDRLAQNRAAVRAWISKEIEQGRMTFVRRFDHDLTGDYVFALTSVEPRAATWRAPEVPDPSGRTPLQNAAAMLESGAITYNASTYGMTDTPQFYQDVRGTLRVSGWALSPEGISRVFLRFANGRFVVPAELIPRDDVSHGIFPWYPKTVRAGFMADFAKRPKGVGKQTDVQVEVVDGKGRRTRLDDIWFDWRSGPGLKPEDWREEQVYAMVARNGSRPSDARGIMNGTVSIYGMMDALVNDMKCASREELLDRLYRVLLDRGPDPAGWEKYLEQLSSGAPPRKIIDALIGSKEFAEKYLKPGRKMLKR